MEGDPFYLKVWVNQPRWSEIVDFRSIFARSASAVASSKKVHLTLIGSRLRSSTAPKMIIVLSVNIYLT